MCLIIFCFHYKIYSHYHFFCTVTCIVFVVRLSSMLYRIKLCQSLEADYFVLYYAQHSVMKYFPSLRLYMIITLKATL